VDLDRFQELIGETYLERDAERGVAATVAWLAEELGELAQAVRKGTPIQQLHELGDVLAWLASLANQLDLSLTAAASRYAVGCPRCAAIPCACREPEDRRAERRQPQQRHQVAGALRLPAQEALGRVTAEAEEETGLDGPDDLGHQVLP